MTTSVYLPRLILCIPGNWASQDGVTALLGKSKVDFEFQPPDSRMPSAFRSFASRLRPSLTDGDFAALERHTSVVYLLSRRCTIEEAAPCGHYFLGIGRQLLEMGGIAVKCESSGTAHAAKRWADLARESDTAVATIKRPEESADAKAEGRVAFWRILFEAFVAMPLTDNQNLFTCGLHLLGMPDLIVSNAVLEKTFAGSANARTIETARLFTTFALYLLAECPQGSFQSGNTFRSTATAPRFRVTQEPCTGYEEDDLFFNPFGRWRFEPAS